MKKVMVLSILTMSLFAATAYAKEDVAAWSMFNHGASSAKGNLAAHEAASNNTWAMFNAGVSFWRKGTQILPGQENGMQVKLAKTKGSKAYN